MGALSSATTLANRERCFRGDPGCLAVWWVKRRLVLWVLGGGVPDLALGGVTCQKESLKAGGSLDEGSQGEKMVPSHGCIVPAVLLAEMLCAASCGAGEAGGS